MAIALKTGLTEAQVYKWGWDQKRKKFGIAKAEEMRQYENLLDQQNARKAAERLSTLHREVDGGSPRRSSIKVSKLQPEFTPESREHSCDKLSEPRSAFKEPKHAHHHPHQVEAPMLKFKNLHASAGQALENPDL